MKVVLVSLSAVASLMVTVGRSMLGEMTPVLLTFNELKIWAELSLA